MANLPFPLCRACTALALADLEERWGRANERERDALTPEIEGSLGEADATRARAEALIGPEQT